MFVVPLTLLGYSTKGLCRGKGTYLTKCHRKNYITSVFAQTSMKTNVHNHRILEVENATFTALVFSCFGGQDFEQIFEESTCAAIYSPVPNKCAGEFIYF